MEKVENRNLEGVIRLVSPAEVKAELPLTRRACDVVLEARRGVRDILHGRDRQRLVVVVGPCSIHDPQAALEYARLLKPVADATREDLLIIMRTYFEKPRTTVGWKGLINDPRLDGSCDVAAGLKLARSILLEINELGLPCGYEGLDPVTPQYIADLISWAAIGARTTESQTHREMASGLSMPVGFKNGTDGGLQVAVDAMVSARHPHSFLGINNDGMTSVVKTMGNPDRHMVLRGGGGKTNYGSEDIERAVHMLVDHDIARPIMIDCSHGNSAKDHTRQLAVGKAVLDQFHAGQGAIMGLMIESNLKAGKQTWKEGAPLEHGVSITDACIGWPETEAFLRQAAALVERTPRPQAAAPNAPGRSAAPTSL
jgi:3-deoxy-7-phosphoheptulonate synthase